MVKLVAAVGPYLILALLVLALVAILVAPIWFVRGGEPPAQGDEDWP